MKAVVFVLRGCPVGWLGAYGNEWVATPHLDRLAAESVVFDRHISDRPEPAVASAALLGGALPAGSRLIETLASAAIRTVLVRANHPDNDGPEWFYAGWGEVFDARPQEEDESPLDSLIRSLPELLDRLAAIPDFLLWIEIDRLLPPWDVPQDVFDAYFQDDEDGRPEEEDAEEAEALEEELAEEGEDEEAETEGPDPEELDETPATAAADLRPPISNPPAEIPPWSDPPTGLFDTADRDAWEWLHNSFAAVITKLDAELGVIFDQLRARGHDQSATWLVTSDLGYPLGEHGQLGLHRPWLHEELVHLPLIVRLPGADEACRRVYGFTQPPDIAPTLLDIFRMKPHDAASLLPLARGEGESHRKDAVTTLELNGAVEAAMRTDDFALLVPLKVPEGEKREPLLYEKPDDRFEVNDLRPRSIERADELEATLRKQISPESTQPPS